MYTRRLFDSPNPDLNELDRRGNESNDAWLKRAIASLAISNLREWTVVVLLGGKDQLAFRLRLAQAHFRRDMLPSYWSDCLLAEVRAGTIGKVHHVPLLQPGKSFAPSRNGVVESPISTFSSSDEWPNIAVLAFRVPQRKVVDYLDKFRENRDALDSLAHVVRWLGFAWGANGASNPVHEGIGLPSACMVSVACAAAELDIAPGMAVKAVCPEVIWSSSIYWYDHVTGLPLDNTGGNGRRVAGCYHIGHTYDIEDGTTRSRIKTPPKPKTKTAANTPARKRATKAPEPVPPPAKTE